MNSFLRLIAAMVAACCIALAFGTAPGGAARAGNSITYQDSTGEDPASLDIQQIVVSNEDSGMLTFELHFANVSAITGNNAVLVFIDSDNNATDGAGADLSGADMLIGVAAGEIEVGKWDGSNFAFTGSPASLTDGFANGVLTIRVNANDLGLTAFNFFVCTDADVSTEGGPHDVAPDPGHGTYAYQVKISPPATTTATTTHKPGPKAKTPRCKKHQKSTKTHRCHN
jgi:hypothetical protein